MKGAPEISPIPPEDSRPHLDRSGTLSSHLQTVIDAIPDAIMVVNPNHEIVLANQAARNLARQGDPVSEGMKCHELSHRSPTPCKGLQEPCPLQQVIRKGKPVTVTHVHYDAEGAERFVEVSAAPIFDGSGKVARVIEAHRDVTEQKRAEAMLHRERDFVSAVLEIAGALVVVLDPQGRIIRFNRACERTTGYALEEVLNRPVWELLIPPDEAESVRGVFEKLRAGDVPLEHENHWRCKYGGSRLIAWSNTAMVDGRGTLEYVIATGIDITERKQAEKALKALNETLEQRVLERTVAVEQWAHQLRILAAELTQAEQRERKRMAHVLHDHLQQLLVGAKINLDDLRQHPDEREDLQNKILLIEDLLAQALDVSRSLTVELSPPILYDGDLYRILEWLASWMQEKHGLSVDLVTDGSEMAMEEAVRVLLYHAVRELLFNVVKHAGVDRARVTIRRSDGRVEVAVTDSGAGYVPDAKASSGSPAGGFGLSSIRERLKILGGGLTVESAPGKGTRATLRVPACTK